MDIPPVFTDTHQGEINNRESMLYAAPASAADLRRLVEVIAAGSINQMPPQWQAVSNSSMLLRTMVMIWCNGGMNEEHDFTNSRAFRLAPIASALAFCVTSANDGLIVSSLVDFAGGISPMVTATINYLSILTLEVQQSATPLSKHATSQMVALAHGFDRCATFAQAISQQDRSIYLEFIKQGLVKTIATALLAFGPKIIFQAFDETDDDPLIGLRSRRRMLSSGYRYILFAIQNADEAIPLLVQALRSGLIETILRTGACSSAGEAHIYREDIKILQEISTCYLVYDDVLRNIDTVVQQISRYNLQWYAQRDTSVWTAFLELRDTVYRHLAVRAEWISGRLCPPAIGCDAPNCINLSRENRSNPICSGCRMSQYCSKACQRNDWKAEHRRKCKILRTTLGSVTVNREDLYIMRAIEMYEWHRQELHVMLLILQKWKEHADIRSSLAIELDMTANPMVFRVHSIAHYTEITKDADWMQLMDGLMRFKATSNISLLPLIRVRQGRVTRVLYSPRMALGMVYNWPHVYGNGQDNPWADLLDIQLVD